MISRIAMDSVRRFGGDPRDCAHPSRSFLERSRGAPVTPLATPEITQSHPGTPYTPVPSPEPPSTPREATKAAGDAQDLNRDVQKTSKKKCFFLDSQPRGRWGGPRWYLEMRWPRQNCRGPWRPWRADLAGSKRPMNRWETSGNVPRKCLGGGRSKTSQGGPKAPNPGISRSKCIENQSFLNDFKNCQGGSKTLAGRSRDCSGPSRSFLG